MKSILDLTMRTMVLDGHAAGPCWQDVKGGDALVDQDGTSIFIKECALDDGQFISYVGMYIVGPADCHFEIGTRVMIGGYNSQTIAPLTLVKSARE